MRIAVLVNRSLRGSGFATRISSMLEWYVASGHEVDVFHYRFQHEDELRSPLAASLHRYVTVPMQMGGSYRQHAALLPPLAWHCTRAHSLTEVETGRYDVVQAETSNTWSIARTLSATKRLAVLHDDDSARLKGLARIAPRGVRRMAINASARKYWRLQRVVLKESDRVWFASEIERDRLASTEWDARTRVIPNGAGDELWSVPPIDGGICSDVLFVAPGFYEANSSGLAWFMDEVWPLVRQRVRGGHVRVVGLGWERFGTHPGASFVGWRDSLVGEYSRARVIIAPLFAGGGTKLKVVEAMASARPVVTTHQGAQGVPPSAGLRACVNRREFAAEVIRFLTDANSASLAGVANRSAVEGLRWSSVWSRASSDLDELVSTRS